KFDVNMYSHFTIEALKRFLDDLREYGRLSRAAMETPELYYALRLICFQAAFHAEEQEKALVAIDIINFFKKNAVLFLDESHRTLNPNTRAISSVGETQTIDLHDRETLFMLMKPLLGMIEVKVGETTVEALGGIRTKAKTAPTKAEIGLIKKA